MTIYIYLERFQSFVVITFGFTVFSAFSKFCCYYFWVYGFQCVLRGREVNDYNSHTAMQKLRVSLPLLLVFPASGNSYQLITAR